MSLSLVRIIRDSWEIKKTELLYNYLTIFALTDLSFNPGEYKRIEKEIIVDLPQKFSAILIGKNYGYSKKISGRRRLFFNFINTYFVKTFLVKKANLSVSYWPETKTQTLKSNTKFPTPKKIIEYQVSY